jgi:predicted nucleic acid-binding protein
VILVDSNVLIDVATNDPVWSEWSQQQLTTAATVDELAINDLVYAGVDELDRAIQRVGITLAPIPRAALFIAGRVFQRYRAAGGIRTGVLPDFFLGAHAAVAGVRLLTRDTRRYRTYFPELTLIAPTHN